MPFENRKLKIGRTEKENKKQKNGKNGKQNLI